MEPLPASSSTADATTLGSRMAVLMFSVMAGTCLSLVAMAHNRPLANWIRDIAWQQSNWKKQIPIFCFNEHFVDSEDRLLHQDLPAADYSRGGVYILGASSVAWATKLWELSPEKRSLIHNYAMRGTNHADQLDLLRFLVEKQGFLDAGGEKTLVIFGVSYHSTHNARTKENLAHERFTRMWTRHGVYTVEPDDSIHSTGLISLARWLIVERVKMTGLLKELVNLAYAPFKSIRVQDQRFYNAEWTRAMESNWKEKIDTDLAAFVKTIDYLRGRQVQIVVVLIPQASWDRDLPFEQTYSQQVFEICRRANLTIYDWRKILADDQFADSVHLTPSGIDQFQLGLMEICLAHLRSTGALPQVSTSEPN